MTSSRGETKNIIFLGSTGSGRSSTCNTISGLTDGYFKVNHKPVSEETHTDYYLCEPKNIRLIDTPGFGDSKISEEKIDGILKQLVSMFGGKNEDESKRKIDAFVLVVKVDSYTAHAETLVSDIDRIQSVFGNAALKTLLILPIYTNHNHQQNSPDFIHEMKKYNRILKDLKLAKGEDLNENWFCLWSNQKPRENQESEFFEKISKLEPYTQENLKQFEQHEDLGLANHMKDEYIKYQESKERLQKETQKILAATAKININTKAILDQVYSRMRKESEESTNKFLETVHHKHSSLYPPLDTFLEENQKIIGHFRTYVKEGPKAQKEPKEVEELAMDILKTDNKREQTEKAKELTGAAAKKGAEKIAEKGATEVVKKVVFFGASKVCNIF